MYHSILVPLDGSPLSEQALPVACELACRSRATLRLVHVHVPVTATPIHIDGMPVVDENLQSLGKAHAHAYLDRIRDRLGTQVFPIAVAVLDTSDPDAHEPTVPATLAAHAATSGTDLIVMTTRGRGGLARLWLGSVAAALVLASPVPVLSLRPGEPVSPAEHSHVFRRILIPLDGSARAEAILEPALALGDLAGAEYTLLQVVEPFGLAGYAPHAHAIRLNAQVTQEGHAAAQHYLNDLAERLRAGGRKVHTRTRLAERPADAILAVAREEGSDVIALATHGRSGLTRLVVGSVADKVRRGAEMPVLLYRPQAPDESTGRCRAAAVALPA